jgi:glycosyltransferase involved in cell wall biosynthesis
MLRALLQAVAQHPLLDLDVFFCAKVIAGRTWRWNEQALGYKARVLNGVQKGAVCFNPGIVTICARGNYDLFIVNGWDQPTNQLAMLTLNCLRKRWALAGERPGFNSNSAVRNFLRSFALASAKHGASCAIGVGDLAKRDFQRLLGDGRMAYSVPYLFDLVKFLALPLPSVGTGPVRFLFSGQLIPRKGIDILCDATDRLFAAYPNTYLTVMGTGPELYKLERLSANYPGRVNLKGFLPFDYRAEGYRDAHVFVFPSRYDGWGMVVHEAMACGLPVIGSNTTGAAYELVENNVNGFTLGSLNPTSYFDAMKHFVENRDRIGQFGLRAREKASTYTPQWGADELLKIVSRESRPSKH